MSLPASAPSSIGTQPGAPAPQRRLPFWGAAGLVALVGVAYWPVMRGQFVWDDQLLVIQNPLVTGQFNLANVWWRTDFSLSTVALWGQWCAWGAQATGYHLVNLGLHAISCLLLWRSLRQLDFAGAGLAAALFAVHPVAAASVAWISELKNTLSLVFFLASGLLFLQFEESSAGTGRSVAPRGYLLSLGTFWLALLSKSSTVVLPVVLLGVAAWRRGRVTRRDLRRLAPFFLLALLCGAATIHFQGSVMSTADPPQTENIFGRFAAAGLALWFYLGKILLPLKLSMIYPRWQIDSGAVVSYLPAGLWLLTLGLAWRFRRWDWIRAAGFGLAAFTVMIFPVLGFLSMDYLVISRVSDHFQYLPMLAVVVLVAAGLSRGLSSRVRPAVVGALVLFLTGITFQRAQILAHSESLWRDTLEKNPASFTAHNNLGCLLAAQNHLAEAIAQFEATLQLRSNNVPALVNLGRAHALRHESLSADEYFKAALTLKPKDADAQMAYALALAPQARWTEALEHARQAVDLEPQPERRLQLAACLRGAGQYAAAIDQYREVLRHQSDSVEALNNAAWLLATCSEPPLRRGAEAVGLAEKAVRLTGKKQAAMIGTLAAAYAEAGRFSEAITTATAAAELAQTQGDAGFAAQNRQLLWLYRQGQAYHEPPSR